MMKHILTLSLIMLCFTACASQNVRPVRSAKYVDPIALGQTSEVQDPVNGADVFNFEPTTHVDNDTTEVPEAVPQHISDTGVYLGDIQETVNTGVCEIKTGKPYVIKGITYYPLQGMPENYQEEGIASWYGEEFHGRNTSNGEVFDMYALSAAHKTLPMPTYVQVTNLENGKSVVVRVNDRGPFSKGRIIDLSYAAANEIGMLEKGTARVHITLLSQDCETLTTDNIPEALETGVFAVQIGAFSDKDNANRLANAYNNARITDATINGKAFYRVQLTGYNSVEEAEDAAITLSTDYPGSFVVRQ